MKKACWMVVLCAAIAGAAQAQYAHTQGQQVIGRDGKPLLLRGTNLGNWMVPEGYMFQFAGHTQSAGEIERLMIELIGPERDRAFWKQWRDRYITREDIHLIASAGFNSIRVPFHYKYFQTDEDEGFRLVDRLVTWARAEGVYLILDMHAAPGGQTGTNIDDSDGYPWLFEDAGAQQQMVDTWQRIARHYKNEPVILGYDLLNEPIPTYPQLKYLNPRLEPLYKRATAAVRKEDKHHAIILGGAQWDNNFDVFGTPFDTNAIYQFHHYTGPPPEQKLVQPYVDFRAKYNVPIWLGESGENEDTWIAHFRELLERNDIGWAFWPYKKIGSTRGIETIAVPEGWASIVAYTKLADGVGLTKERLMSRPEQAVIDRAIASLLENIEFAKCTANAGYIHALLPVSPVGAAKP